MGRIIPSGWWEGRGRRRWGARCCSSHWRRWGEPCNEEEERGVTTVSTRLLLLSFSVCLFIFHSSSAKHSSWPSCMCQEHFTDSKWREGDSVDQVRLYLYGTKTSCSRVTSVVYLLLCFKYFSREADRVILMMCQQEGANQNTFQIISSLLGNKTPSEVIRCSVFGSSSIILFSSSRLSPGVSQVSRFDETVSDGGLSHQLRGWSSAYWASYSQRHRRLTNQNNFMDNR